MHINSFDIVDYKCFVETPHISLKKGINIIVGPNNAGKTALLESLSLTGKTNLSKQVMQRLSPEEDESKVCIDVEILRDEYKAILSKSGRISLSKLPFSPPPQMSDMEIANWLDSIANREKIRLKLLYGMGQKNRGLGILESDVRLRYPKGDTELEGAPHGTNFHVRCFMDTSGKLQAYNSNQNTPQSHTLYDLLVSEFRSRLYFFKAQRAIPSQCSDEGNRTLKPDASNLAEVISNFGEDRKAHREFDELVRMILPQIYEVTFHKVDGNLALREIVVHETEASEAISLEHCGTGIGQVLAMLYILATSKESKILIIDEPQSFLHPGAVRKLVSLFRERSQHQYIISTHDPTVIAASQPSTISLVTKEREQPSTIMPIDVVQTRELRYCLNQVGANLSDVFGADFVLWVEGLTESECYPLIIEKLTDIRMGAIVIVPVVHTDELSGKDTERLIKMYEKLSSGVGIQKDATSFLLDKECRSDHEVKELINRSNERLHFLSYRMYENYLIDSEAIAEAVKYYDAEFGNKVTADKVEEYLQELIQDKNLYCEKQRLRSDIHSEWKQFIRGAEVLHRIFAHFSDVRLQYNTRKPEYGLYLTKWILQNKPKLLEEVAEQLKKIIQSR